jgi:hypothetical protein
MMVSASIVAALYGLYEFGKDSGKKESVQDWNNKTTSNLVEKVGKIERSVYRIEGMIIDPSTIPRMTVKKTNKIKGALDG